MNTYFETSFRAKLLIQLHRIFSFNIQGNLKNKTAQFQKNFISCLIPSARGPEFIKTIWSDLAQQTLSKESFEIITLESSSGEILLGSLRNQLLSKAKGEYILFLDDDTRLLQNDFLEKALLLFQQYAPDVIMPLGEGIAPLNKPKYTFLDSYSFATRCCLYKKSALESINGFHEDITSYEDIDLGIRLSMNHSKILKTNELRYLHSAVYFKSMRKPLAIGQSVWILQKYYPLPLWILLYLNGIRFLVLGLIPTTRNRQWFKISLGILIGGFIKKKLRYC
jgi:hypothetical protein